MVAGPDQADILQKHLKLKMEDSKNLNIVGVNANNKENILGVIPVDLQLISESGKQFWQLKHPFYIIEGCKELHIPHDILKNMGFSLERQLEEVLED